MKTRTKRNDPNQMAFNFQPVRPGFPICETVEEIGATLAAFGIDGKSKKPSVPLSAPVVAVQTVAGTNATFEVSPGSFRRVHFIRETLHGRYCEIQFPGATYANGRPRIQSINRAVVTLDPF